MLELVFILTGSYPSVHMGITKVGLIDQSHNQIYRFNMNEGLQALYLLCEAVLKNSRVLRLMLMLAC